MTSLQNVSAGMTPLHGKVIALHQTHNLTPTPPPNVRPHPPAQPPAPTPPHPQPPHTHHTHTHTKEQQVQIDEKGKEIKVVKIYFSKIKFFFSFWSVVRSGEGDDAAKL